MAIFHSYVTYYQRAIKWICQIPSMFHFFLGITSELSPIFTCDTVLRWVKSHFFWSEAIRSPGYPYSQTWGASWSYPHHLILETCHIPHFFGLIVKPPCLLVKSSEIRFFIVQIMLEHNFCWLNRS